MREQLGKFQILRPLGRGTMGEVYLATDTVLGRQVAIKTIQAGSSFGDEARARFEREARVTGTLAHPNIVTVYDFGESDGLYFLAMEFVEGDTFEGCLGKGSLSRPDLLEALAQVSEALAFAHEHGVIHRDVKPSNILVKVRGKRILAKLMDFGVATVDQSSLTQQGIWMGTVNYMAPEYLDTGRATASSDLFAIGVMLYEVITGGRRPFRGETTTTILNAILRESPAPLTPEEIRSAGAPLLAVLRRALAKRPEDRFQTGEELAEAIRDAMVDPTPMPEGEPGPGGAASRVGPPNPVAAPALPEEVSRPVPGPTTRLVKEHGSRPIVVGRGGAATMLSLRVALRQVEPGGTIRVLPGHYRESLVIDKPVRILAEGSAGEVVLEASQGTSLTVTVPGVEIEGLVFHSPQGPGLEGLALHVTGGELALRSCRIQGDLPLLARVEGAASRLSLLDCTTCGSGDTGILVAEGATLQGQDSVFEGFLRAGVMAERAGQVRFSQVRMGAGSGVGLGVRSGAQVVLEGCTLEGREAGGVEVEDQGRVSVTGGGILGSRMAGLLVLGRAEAFLEGVGLESNGAAGIHVEGEGRVVARQCRLKGNGGFGASLRGGAMLTLEEGEVTGNGQAGVLIGSHATAQMKGVRIQDGRSVGVACLAHGRGVMEGCDICGNAQSGGRVESGGSLLLLRCTLRDGQETGLMVFQDAEATLEQCVVHRNARGGILLAKDASDPIIRDAEGIQDDLYRIGAGGEPVKVAPVRRR